MCNKRIKAQAADSFMFNSFKNTLQQTLVLRKFIWYIVIHIENDLLE